MRGVPDESIFCEIHNVAEYLDNSVRRAPPFQYEKITRDVGISSPTAKNGL